ncbi:MAG: DUF1311 domain-containing protein [Akkermansiaceae bacterium]|tara:strand:- start:3566 stop:3922 length:357 start_codon:yes stop_codon:yes gene_type:complete
MKTFALLLLITFFSTLCNAQTNSELKAQAYARHEKADKAMNTAYKALLSSLNEVGQKRLKISQRAWITFRDAQADFDCHHFDGGSFEGLERIGSLDQLTQARTKRLLADYKRFKEIFE